MSLPRFSELGNTPKVENEDPLLVNPLVELCAGFVSKLNVSLFNYTAQTPGQGNQILHCYKKLSCFSFPSVIALSSPHVDKGTFFSPPTEYSSFAHAGKVPEMYTRLRIFLTRILEFALFLC